MAFADGIIKRKDDLLCAATDANVKLIIAKGVSCEGFNKILSVSEKSIRLSFYKKKIEISGEKLKVVYLNQGEIIIDGEVKSIAYEE